MNSELKALIDLVFDAEDMVQALVKKENFFSLLPKVFSLLTGDVPQAIMNWGDLQAEIAALPGSAQESDLAAYVEKKFSGILPSGKGPAVLSAVLKLVVDMAQDGVALSVALKG